MSGIMPVMNNITDYFDMSSLDLNNGLWKNILSGNDMTVSGGILEDDALKLVSGEWGELVTNEPLTMYIVLKKPTRETDCCMLGKGLSTKTQKADLGLWSSGKNNVSYTMSVYGSPYVRTIVDDSIYHVVVLAKKSAIDTDSQGGAMLYVDGELKGFVTGTLTGSYAGFVTLNRRYNVGYTSACETDTYVRAIAIGGEQTVEQIVTNCEYLLTGVRPETGDSKMAGADAAAIAWCIARNLEQSQSVEMQKKAYREGLGRGEGVVEPWETENDKIEFDTDEDGKSTSDVGYTDLNRGVKLFYANPDDPTDTREVKIFLDHSLDEYMGWNVHGLLTIIVYDKDGNELSVARMPGANSTHIYTWHTETNSKFTGYRINAYNYGGNVSGHYVQTNGSVDYWTSGNTVIYSPSWNCSGYVYTGATNI